MGRAKALPSACQKSLAEFAAWDGKESQKIFRRGAYLAENTSQTASVEFVPQGDKLCAQQAAKVCRKSGLFPQPLRRANALPVYRFDSTLKLPMSRQAQRKRLNAQ